MAILAQKAERATITLGSIDIEVFLLEDGEYRLSKTQVFESVDIVSRNTPRWLKSQGLKPLSAERLQFTEKGIGGTIDSIGISEAIKLWYHVGTQLKNEKASNLVLACAIESVERRADAKFGKIRSEEERNQRIIAKTESKNLFFDFSGEIASWFDRTKAERSQPVERYYSVAYDTINRGLFGKSSKQIRAELGVPTAALIRDYFNAESLRRITQVQSISAGQMRKNPILRPLDAAKFALDCSCFDVIEFKTESTI